MAPDYCLEYEGVAEWPDLYSRQGQGFLFSMASTLPLVLSQPPIQWVPGTSSPGIKRPKRETGHSLPPIAEVKNGGDIPQPFHRSSRRGTFTEMSKLKSAGRIRAAKAFASDPGDTTTAWSIIFNYHFTLK
jgi:hypothetical protein